MDIIKPEMLEQLQKLLELLPLLLPVILIQWALMLYALIKLLKSERQPAGIPKWAWVLIILLVNIIGPVLYLTIGRREE